MYEDSADHLHLNHNVKKTSLFNGMTEKKKKKEKLHLSFPMFLMPNKATKIKTNKPIKNNDIYDLLLKIPAGRVTTYGDLAKAVGNPSASRVIGRILGENPNPIRVPCHRVVMSDGQVGGYAYGTSKKKQLLEDEGILFVNEIVQNFKNIRVYPQRSSNSSKRRA